MPDRNFDIDLNYKGDVAYLASFEDAIDRWEDIITADLPKIGKVDDLLIKARVRSIDGAGDILGEARPTYVRTDGGLPFKGVTKLDEADVQTVSDRDLTDLITHEIGHVLGLGTLWDSSWFNFVDYNKDGYTGENALREYRQLSGDSSASFVPLETSGGSGTAYSHWSEDVFDDEVMTGFANGDMSISRMTVGALEDLGYTVDYSQADRYWF